MVVEYHHADTGRWKLRPRELQAAANEDAAVLQLGASNPSLAEEGTAGVDLKLELDGLPLDDYLASGDVDESLVASTVDAARVITGDQVELTGVAASADGIFVQIHVSGIDDAGARSEAAPISVVDLEVESAIAFENLDASALNGNTLLQFKKAIVAPCDAGADYAATYLSEFVAGVAAAADDGLFVQVLQQGGQVFADVAVDAEATPAVLEVRRRLLGIVLAAADADLLLNPKATRGTMDRGAGAAMADGARRVPGARASASRRAMRGLALVLALAAPAGASGRRRAAARAAPASPRGGAEARRDWRPAVGRRGGGGGG
ncbi:hypothetical protein JL722_9141 [Aureococcus anophagefferens]|nr:hypothetical protein JL722_9141 [Aureococcus anophagefferens]